MIHEDKTGIPENWINESLSLSYGQGARGAAPGIRRQNLRWWAAAVAIYVAGAWVPLSIWAYTVDFATGRLFWYSLPVTAVLAVAAGAWARWRGQRSRHQMAWVVALGLVSWPLLVYPALVLSGMALERCAPLWAILVKAYG